jgi:hypothetical protein
MVHEVTWFPSVVVSTSRWLTEDTYRTHANKGRADYSKIIFWALRLSHEKYIKSAILHDNLGGGH